MLVAAKLGGEKHVSGGILGTKADGFSWTAGSEMEKPVVASDFAGTRE